VRCYHKRAAGALHTGQIYFTRNPWVDLCWVRRVEKHRSHIEGWQRHVNVTRERWLPHLLHGCVWTEALAVVGGRLWNIFADAIWLSSSRSSSSCRCRSSRSREASCAARCSCSFRCCISSSCCRRSLFCCCSCVFCCRTCSSWSGLRARVS
jgi:hypothetical protein